MKNKLQILAILANLGLFICLLALWADNGWRVRGDGILVVLMLAVPALSLAALFTRPDREVRRLQHEVKKAELELRLKLLREGKAEGLGSGHTCCK